LYLFRFEFAIANQSLSRLDIRIPRGQFPLPRLQKQLRQIGGEESLGAIAETSNTDRENPAQGNTPATPFLSRFALHARPDPWELGFPQKLDFQLPPTRQIEAALYQKSESIRSFSITLDTEFAKSKIPLLVPGPDRAKAATKNTARHSRN
jgi:hypothetical protein